MRYFFDKCQLLLMTKVITLNNTVDYFEKLFFNLIIGVGHENIPRRIIR